MEQSTQPTPEQLQAMLIQVKAAQTDNLEAARALGNQRMQLEQTLQQMAAAEEQENESAKKESKDNEDTKDKK